jgi:hypothetical protein
VRIGRAGESESEVGLQLSAAEYVLTANRNCAAPQAALVPAEVERFRSHACMASSSGRRSPV